MAGGQAVAGPPGLVKPTWPPGPHCCSTPSTPRPVPVHYGECPTFGRGCRVSLALPFFLRCALIFVSLNNTALPLDTRSYACAAPAGRPGRGGAVARMVG